MGVSIQFIGHLIPNDSRRLTVRNICVYMYTSQKRIMKTPKTTYDQRKPTQQPLRLCPEPELGRIARSIIVS